MRRVEEMKGATVMLFVSFLELWLKSLLRAFRGVEILDDLSVHFVALGVLGVQVRAQIALFLVELRIELNKKG